MLGGDLGSRAKSRPEGRKMPCLILSHVPACWFWWWNGGLGDYLDGKGPDASSDSRTSEVSAWILEFLICRSRHGKTRLRIIYLMEV